MEKEYWFVSLAGILSGFIIFGAGVFAEMGLSLYQISVFPALFVFLFLPFIILKKKFRIRKSMLKVLALFGLFAAVSNFTEFGPVILGVPIAVIVLLLYTQPVWTTIIGRVFLKERITRRRVLAVIIVLIGIGFIVNPFTISSIGSPIGVLLALMGGVVLSTWVIMGRVAGKSGYHPLTTNFGYYFFMLVFLAISYPIMALFVSEPSIMNFSFNLAPEIWLYLLGFAFIVFIPHIIYFYGARRVPASVSGIILLLEPVVAALMASVFLQQPLTFNILVGGALILVSNYIVMNETREVPVAV